MAKPKQPAAPPDKIALYDALLASVPGVERKGATNIYTSLNGNMFSYMDGSGVLALRLPEPEKSDFMRRFDAALHRAYGVVQKEYVSVPADVLADTASLTPYLAAAWRHVHALKAKPNKRAGGA
jgi:hypothetical protein